MLCCTKNNTKSEQSLHYLLFRTSFHKKICLICDLCSLFICEKRTSTSKWKLGSFLKRFDVIRSIQEIRFYVFNFTRDKEWYWDPATAFPLSIVMLASWAMQLLSIGTDALLIFLFCKITHEKSIPLILLHVKEILKKNVCDPNF